MRLAHAGSVDPTDAVNRFSVKVTSLKEARYQSTIRQQYDYSCGSAALATLLTHHYGDPVTERMVFDSMYDNGIKEKIRREGFRYSTSSIILRRAATARTASKCRSTS
ncbi:MAG: hypothetical protein H0V78_13985, partial [Burkholderiales bacterium]|nr:hypothetical protein [Burkholderiales bacterium]